MAYTKKDARSMMHAHSISRDIDMQKARDCKEYVGRHGHEYSPTVRRIVSQHVRNARFHNHQAIHLKRI